MSIDTEAMRQLADLQQRLTRAEERLEQGDPRVTEALETARAALSSAASAEDLRKITTRLEAELARVSNRLPRAKSVGVDDPAAPPDPNAPPDPQSQNDPPSDPPQPPPAPGSTSPAQPLVTQRRRRRF